MERYGHVLVKAFTERMDGPGLEAAVVNYKELHDQVCVWVGSWPKRLPGFVTTFLAMLLRLCVESARSCSGFHTCIALFSARFSRWSWCRSP